MSCPKKTGHFFVARQKLSCYTSRIMNRNDFLSVWNIPKYKRRVFWLAAILCIVFYFFLLEPTKKLYYTSFYGAPAEDSSYTRYLDEPFQEELEQQVVYNMSKENMTISMKTIASYKFYGMMADRFVFGIDQETEEEKKRQEKEGKDYTSEIAPFRMLLVYGPLADENFLKKYGFKATDRTFKQPKKSEAAYAKALRVTANIYPLRFLTKNYIIPANSGVYKILKNLKPYGMVYLEGALVEYEGIERDETGKETAFSRASSLSQDEGAERIFYVQKVIVDGYEYR